MGGKGTTSTSNKIFFFALILALVAVVFIYNMADLASQAIKYQLSTLGSSIYEYQRATGQWPRSTGDLAKTSIALQMNHWQDDLQSGKLVVVWPKDLSPNPKDNADYILAYFTGGLISRFGWQWVCWGDLHLEYLPTEKLQAALKSAKD
jgi:hypothetical protein